METRILAIIRSLSIGLLSVLAVLGYQYPGWHWVPIAAGVLSAVNLNFIPAVTAALSPTPVVQVALTPKDQEKPT